MSGRGLLRPPGQGRVGEAAERVLGEPGLPGVLEGGDRVPGRELHNGGRRLRNVRRRNQQDSGILVRKAG